MADAYVRTLKVSLSESELSRVRKWASPTTSMRAWEAYVRGRTAAARGGQEGNEAAVDALSKAIEVDPQFVAAQYALGVVHQALGNRWKAAAQFRASTQLDPTFPEPYKALGDLFLTAPRRLFDQAIEAYTKAIELRPFYADAYVGLGDAKAAKGDVDGAVGAYQKALGYNPVNARVHVSLGKLYYTEKNLYYESVTAYKKAIELDPDFVDARMGLAEVYEDKGLYKDAIVEYKRVVDADAQEHGRALQPGPRLREGRRQGVHRALGALHRARREAAEREGLGGRCPSPPAKAEEPGREVAPGRFAGPVTCALISRAAVQEP